MTKNKKVDETYLCECGEQDCGLFFKDVDYENGYEMCKHNETWAIISQDCSHRNTFFPIFYHKNFMIVNLARTFEWESSHPGFFLTLDKSE